MPVAGGVQRLLLSTLLRQSTSPNAEIDGHTDEDGQLSGRSLR